MITKEYCRFSRAFIILAMISMTISSCSGSSSGGDDGSTVAESNVESTEPLEAWIVSDDLERYTISGNYYPHISVNEGTWINLQAEAYGGKPPYTFHWNMDGVLPDQDVEDIGEIKLDVAGSKYGSRFHIELIVTDSDGEEVVDSFTLVIYDS